MPARKTIPVSTVFTRLTVSGPPEAIRFTEKHGIYTAVVRLYYPCKCECGTLLKVRSDMLRSGNTKSCGCYHKQRVSETHTTHGMSDTLLYQRWEAMIQRCCNQNSIGYHRYGGRGICVCSEWRNSFQAFADYVGQPPTPRHEIERINNNGNYEPGNVKWATHIEQNRNTRRNRVFTINGVTACVTELCAIHSINISTANYRLRTGVPPLAAFTMPVRKR